MSQEFELRYWVSGALTPGGGTFFDEAAAQSEAERLQARGDLEDDQVTMVCWVTHENLPGALPRTVHKCAAMKVLDGDGWRYANIH